jgi:glucose uptake protein GlcU
MLAFFPIAVIQKETSVLLVLVFVISQFRRMPANKIILVSTIMCSLWLVVRMLIMQEFDSNPGSVVQFHLFDHTLRLFAMPFTTGYFLAVVTFLGVLISHGWKSKDEFLRWGFIAVFGPLFLLSLFFGYADELRQFYEAASFVALLIAPSIAKLAGSSD